MIQFNLLPDVKLNYIKAKKTKRMAILISVGCGGTALAIVLLLFLAVNVFQKQHLRDLNSDIAKYSQQLRGTKDLDKILTIQNQLKSLPALHDGKVVSSRLFVFLSQLTPSKATISKSNIDFTTNKLTINGSADDISTINKFADTLKFTTYTAGDKKGNAFSNVVLTNFNRDNNGTSYQLDMSFDPAIFDNAQDAKLTVPSIISTRSETEKPTDLFQTSNTGQGQ